MSNHLFVPRGGTIQRNLYVVIRLGLNRSFVGGVCRNALLRFAFIISGGERNDDDADQRGQIGFIRHVGNPGHLIPTPSPLRVAEPRKGFRELRRERQLLAQ
jgi:hypothetical protein